MRQILLSIMFCAFATVGISAQTTAFTFQGILKDGALPANGNYDFEFRLFDMVSGGTQQGIALQRLNVAVSSGNFTVSLDFGAITLPGADRFLDIAVRTAGGGAFTPLSPRQKVNSAPYAVRSLNSTMATNATQLGGVAASQYVVTTDPRMTDARPPTAGSANYIQNTTNLQSLSNFNVSGTGTANVFNSTSDYNIFGFRVLSILGTNNAFVGVGAGTVNSGSQNAFFGRDAGEDNTTGSRNAFFGGFAGRNNLTASDLAFFGADSGAANSTGINNAFFGSQSGRSNTTGSSNAFFGKSAGQSNIGGQRNSFFGTSSGVNNTSGQDNTLVGSNSGVSLSSGSNNAFFGSAAGQQTGITGNNSFFGNASGIANTGGSNSFFGSGSGFGTTSGNNNSFFGNSAGLSNTTGSSNTVVGDSANVGAGNLSFATAIGAQAVVGTSNTIVLGRPADTVRIPGGLIISESGYSQNGGFGVRPVFSSSGNSLYVGGDQQQTGAFTVHLGHRAGNSNTTGSFNVFVGAQAGQENIEGQRNVFVGYSSGATNTSGTSNTLLGSASDVSVGGLTYATAIGASSEVSASNTIALGRTDGSDKVRAYGNLTVNGTVTIGTFAASTSTNLCTAFLGTVALCSSSIRYKNSVASLGSGLDVVSRLRPVTFKWNESGEKDLGLIAEETEAVDPLLVTYNKDGQIQGVKYDQLTVVLVNAVNQQQSQIQQQQERIERQQAEINALKKLVCAVNTGAAICRNQQ